MQSPLLRRWLDTIDWALRTHGDGGSLGSRRAVIRSLRGLEADLQSTQRGDVDEAAYRNVSTLHAILRSTTDAEWQVTLHELQRLVVDDVDDLWTAAVMALPLPPRISAVPPAPDAHRAVVEGRGVDGRIAFVWVQQGDVVRHQQQRSPFDERWPQEGRIQSIEGKQLHVELLGRHHQSLRLHDLWLVDDVRIPAAEDLDNFERAAPQDLCAFGLDVAQAAPDAGRAARGRHP